MKTIDYWTLSARHPDTGQSVSFETLKFLPVGAKETPNKSIILWESEQPAEIMFSFTGYIFDDSAKAADAQKIGFDEVELNAVMKDAESLDINVRTDVFEKGKLVVTLHRTWPIDYVAAGNGTTARDYLSGSLAVRLIDNQGNAHNRKVSFLPDGVGRRNRLMHSLYSSPDEAVASK
ncbi:Imidazoleglycerol-phosphate synthase [Pseudomonas avellanae BPIC 631]|nr:Imidazoleglycerol-phosphate synthase [Pseudomonas avellanae BPIC 631]